MTLNHSEVLACSGNDLKDYYHFFSATRSRARRNVLVGAMMRGEVCHLHAFKPHHAREKAVFGALNTLAMGDAQAVESAQTCHLALALQRGILHPDQLLSLNMPLPRRKTVGGILIDDFVMMSRVDRDAAFPTEAATRADDMQETYKNVKLQPNEGKAFRDQRSVSFWGADADGVAGLIRGSMRRSLPLQVLLLDIANCGVATHDLLQIVTGSLISLFLFRRRFLALLDPLFQSYRGREPDAVFALSPVCR